ncbi:MAG: hypothetical protein H7Y04_02685 [Verrucomicrobia bacterium]|nr:hypothetical protein [Cytophagales bacterium]
MPIFFKSKNIARSFAVYSIIASLCPVFVFAQQARIKEYTVQLAKARFAKNITLEATYLNKLAHLYWHANYYTTARDYFEQQLKTEIKLGRQDSVMQLNEYLGNVEQSLGRYRPALKYYQEYSAMIQKKNEPLRTYKAFGNTATMYNFLGKHKNAIQEMEKALWMAKTIRDTRLMQNCYLKISEYYNLLRDSKKSLEYYKYYNALNSVIQQEKVRKAELDKLSTEQLLEETQVELEEMNRELALKKQRNLTDSLRLQDLNKQKQLNEMRLKQQETIIRHDVNIRNLFIAIGLIVLATATFVFRDYRKIRKLNTRLGIQNHEISERKREVSVQNARLEESQKQLLDAKVVIQEQNLKLQAYNRDLEKQVVERTADLQKAYNELLIINNDLDILTYRASHDLKSPVASLDGLCSVALLEMADKDHPSTPYFSKIKEIASNMASLLDSLARLRDIKHMSLKIADVSVLATVQDILKSDLKTWQPMEGTIIETNIPEDLLVRTDAGLYHLILRNIIQNAINFNYPVSKNHQPRLSISASENENNVEVQISDNGEGIAKEIVSKIFNMFFRGSVRSKGSGLGLYLCRTAIEKLGGSIIFSQKPTKETVFAISIPKPQEKTQPAPSLLTRQVEGFSTQRLVSE